MPDNTKVFETADFIEQLLRHLAGSAEVMYKAKEFNLSADDFVINDIVGIKIYREFARILLMIGQAPVAGQLFLTYIKQSIDSGTIDEAQREQVADLYNYVFNDTSPLSGEFIANNISQFIKYRRILKAKINNKDDFDKLVTEYTKINNDIKVIETSSVIKTLSPFRQLSFREERTNLVPTGLKTVDDVIKGHGKGELGFIIGYSGQGKTTLITKMARGAAANGHKALIITLEEPGHNIQNRLWSSVFKIPYTEIHQDVFGIRDSITVAFNDMKEEEKKQLFNIEIADARDIDPTPENLKLWLEKWCVEHSFFPDVIFIDQLSFLRPSIKVKMALQKWELYDQVATELKPFADHKIMGKYRFALWVTHQALGNPKISFNRSEISGYKGIIQPASIVMGIGRELNALTLMNLFSIKTRHTQSFSCMYKTELEYMDLVPATEAESAEAYKPPTAAPMAGPPKSKKPTTEVKSEPIPVKLQPYA